MALDTTVSTLYEMCCVHVCVNFKLWLLGSQLSNTAS